MGLDRLVVRNFRNVADLDLRLLPGSVIVGENHPGKSNLIEALRLIFDPTMSFNHRQLKVEDFWMSEADLAGHAQVAVPRAARWPSAMIALIALDGSPVTAAILAPSSPKSAPGGREPAKAGLREADQPTGTAPVAELAGRADHPVRVGQANRWPDGGLRRGPSATSKRTPFRAHGWTQPPEVASMLYRPGSPHTF